ncbi:MAG: hypothetical protein QOE79_1255 [Sphingomonadales bacterium]|nr:hypothetical protein [Sphingomonadales bacterium]
MARAYRAIAGLAAAAFVLASCGKGGGNGVGSDAKGGSGAPAVPPNMLFPDNFKGVCSGASVSAATAYDPAAKAHKALYFATYKDDLTDSSSSLPADWTVRFASDHDALRAIDLVACARRTAAREVKVCDKYQNNGSASQNKVRWHTATYELSLREAKTGETVATTTLEATDAECPMLWSFSSDSETADGYASPSDSAVADFLRPHIVR